MIPRPRSRWTSRVAAGAIAAACSLVAFACADSKSLVMLGTGVTGDGTGVVGADDGGEAGPSLDANTTATMCISTECPEPFATCLEDGMLPPYRCGTDLSNDVDNCGACGNACGFVAGSLNVIMACASGQCQATCNDQYLDCNGVVDDGCEVDPTRDSNHCGGCGRKCPPGVACRGGTCGCPSGTVDCNGGCVNVTADEENCGACNYRCSDHPTDAGAPPPHMEYGCVGGECGVLRCATSPVFWADCNGSLADGCEIDLGGSDLDNCGSCGNKCAPGKACFSFSGAGLDCQCPPGYSQCGENSCYDLESDPANCGSCGFNCDEHGWGAGSVNGRSVCNRGRCGYECKPGFADCNQRLDDGCEADVSRDPHNCGACGVSCDNAAGQPCVGARCATRECDAGEAQR